jgi:SAM-dependent methyltransferase
MTTPPDLVDRTALALHRRRAARRPDLFLHDAVADEAEERLNEVNRTFTAPAVVTPWPDVWRRRLPAAVLVADDDVLDLRPESHDLVIHALCLHWANDPVGQLVQARRALRPDGLMLCATLGGGTLGELRAALAAAEAEVTGGLSPRVLPMGEIRDLGGLLQRAGFALPVADSVRVRASYDGLAKLARDLRAMGEQNALGARRRQTPPRRLFAETERLYRAAYPTEGDRVLATFEVVWLTGWAPGPGQQQPLRPGSASARLADALGTEERPIGDRTGPRRV